jgi:glycerol-3-phosphate acyltransferase PlsY
MSEALAVIIGYLLGSIPSAYLAAKRVLGEDIRKLGGGNVGGLNTFREVGLAAAIFVFVVDVGKGAVAVVIAHYLLEVEPLWVMLAGLASVVGHNWMVWLKFTGGKGMGAAIGALAVLFPLYGYGASFFILLAVILLPLFITKNVALSMGIGLFALPVIVWFVTETAMPTWLSVALLLTIATKFAPTAITAFRKKGGGALGRDDWQRDKAKDS